jgi:hypothetical protein
MLILCMIQEQAIAESLVWDVLLRRMIAGSHMPHELLVRSGRQLVRLDVLVVGFLVHFALVPSWLVEQLERPFEGRLDGLWRELLNVRQLHARLRKQRHCDSWS